VFVVPRIRTVPAPTQRLSHALGGTAAPSRNISVVAPVTAPLAKSSGHGLDGNKSPSPHGAKSKEAMEIDDNDLGHLSYCLEQDDIHDDLPHSTIVRDDHDLASEGDDMQEDWPHIFANPSVSRNKISEIFSWQKCFSELENFMHSEWSEEKFLKGIVGHQMKLCF